MTTTSGVDSRIPNGEMEEPTKLNDEVLNLDATSEETPEPSQTDEVEGESLTKEAIEYMTRGMVYASLAITDDKENTLKKVCIYISRDLSVFVGTSYRE